MREKHGQSQQELAAAIGTRQPRIAEWETGKHKISKVYIRLIQQHFGALIVNNLTQQPRHPGVTKNT